MTDVMDEFPHLNDKTLPELHSRYQALKGDGPSQQLSDATLKELLAISRVLRKRSSAPTAKVAVGKKAPPPSLDAL